MDKKTIRSLFIFSLFFLPVQYGLIGLVSVYKSEPWPAFIFPGFKNVYEYDDDDTHTIIDLEFHAWCEEINDTVVISPLDLFSNIPRSQSQGFQRVNFGDSARPDQFGDQTLKWLKEETEIRNPGHAFTRMDAVWNKKYYNGTLHDSRPDSMAEINRVTISF